MKILTAQEQIQEKIEDTTVLIVYQNEIITKNKLKLEFINETPLFFTKNARIVAKVHVEMADNILKSLEDYRNILQEYKNSYDKENKERT